MGPSYQGLRVALKTAKIFRVVTVISLAPLEQGHRTNFVNRSLRIAAVFHGVLIAK